MKTKVFLCMTALLLLSTTTLFAADEDNAKADDSDSDAVITMCENQYTMEIYPDDEERNKLIDQCITENSPASAE